MIELVKRCANGYDIYLRFVSTLSYAPSVFVISLNGRFIKGAPECKTLEEAEQFIALLRKKAA